MKAVILYRPGPRWLDGRPTRDQPLGPHGAYMKRLFDAGIVQHGGPFRDTPGGLCIIEVADEAAAEAFVRDDPAVVEGVFVAEWRAWYAVDWASYPRT